MKKYANGISKISETFDHRNILFQSPIHSKAQQIIKPTGVHKITLTSYQNHHSYEVSLNKTYLGTQL